MTLTVHHLQRSQSERIVWLCEELGIPYELKVYVRDTVHLGAPAEFKAIHSLGTAPVIQDGNTTLAESGAIIDYLIHKHGNGRFAVSPSAPNYAAYTFWLHYGPGTLMSATALPLMYRKAGLAATSTGMLAAYAQLDAQLRLLDARLKEAKWLAGDEITAADIYAIFNLTTMRVFSQFALEGYEGILRWLGEVEKRPAYRAMIEKGEKGEERGGKMPMVYPEVPKPMW